MNIEERVITAIAHTFDLEINQVKLESTLIKDLGADSLNLVETILAIEEEFDLDIPDDDAIKLGGDCTVQDVVNYVGAHHSE